MKNPQFSVLKFGGSSLATPEQIRAVAKKIYARHQSGEKIIVVTSAMGKTTDQLTELAYKVSTRPHRRELDMLLSTGERISMSLMAMALQDLDCPAISFTGSQAGIMTNNSFSNAQIVDIKPIRVAEELGKNKVVVLAGFQGVDPITKEVTTLGRGGSDTTAVAMAAHFKADRCEILKDVDGVYSCDPKLTSQAQLYSKISIDALYEFCFWGAKVLNYRSVDYARKHKVPLFIGRSDNFSIGTEVSFDSNQTAAEKNSKNNLIGVNSHKNTIELTIACTDNSEGITTLDNVLHTSGLPSQQILTESFSNGSFKVLISIDADSADEIRTAFKASSKIKILRDKISTVSSTYFDAKKLSYFTETQIVESALREKCINEIMSAIK
jgi:aspartate kinase